MEQYRDAKKKPPLPKLPAGAEYLIEAMFAMGPVRSTEGGFRPADWNEIYPYMKATKRITDPDEAEALFAMCEAYVSGLRVGSDPFGIPPMERR